MNKRAHFFSSRVGRLHCGVVTCTGDKCYWQGIARSVAPADVVLTTRTDVWQVAPASLQRVLGFAVFEFEAAAVFAAPAACAAAFALASAADVAVAAGFVAAASGFVLASAPVAYSARDVAQIHP